MDENIKVAANYLHRAAANMQARIDELQRGEYQEKQQEAQAEDSMTKELHQDEFTIAKNAANKNKDQQDAAREDLKLVAHDYDVRKHRDAVKDELNQQVSRQDKEIRSLQDQMRRLSELARSLESWHG